MRHEIPGYEGFYQIDGNDFTIYSMPRNGRSERIVKLRSDKKKYIHFRMSRDAKRRQFLYHRLIALLFVPNPHNFDIVDHKDGNPHNFDPSNLEWVDVSENQRRAYKMGLRKSGAGTTTKKSRCISQYDLNGVFIENHPSLSHAAQSVKVRPSDILRCVNNNSFSCKGHKWSAIN